MTICFIPNFAKTWTVPLKILDTWVKVLTRTITTTNLMTIQKLPAVILPIKKAIIHSFLSSIIVFIYQYIKIYHKKHSTKDLGLITIYNLFFMKNTKIAAHLWIIRCTKNVFSCLFYFSCPAFLDISGPLFRSSYS